MSSNGACSMALTFLLFLLSRLFLGVLCWWDQRGEGLQGSDFISHQEQGTPSRWSSGFSSADQNRSGQSHKFQCCSSSFTAHGCSRASSKSSWLKETKVCCVDLWTSCILAASHVNYHQLSVRAFCPTFTVVQCCAPEEVQINRELHLGRHSLW